VGLILDTNALSAVAEGERKAVKEFARADEVAIPVIVLGEYRFGISHSRHKHENERWLASWLLFVGYSKWMRGPGLLRRTWQ
jgi:predicted nucleic acid-binding protein